MRMLLIVGILAIVVLSIVASISMTRYRNKTMTGHKDAQQVKRGPVGQIPILGEE